MLTGSDSAPAKANEAKQANDIGAMKDEIALVAQNAQMDAYNDVYVDNNSTITRGQASTVVGQKVIDEILKHFGKSARGTSTGKIDEQAQRGNVTVKIEQDFEGNAKITVSTTDIEKEGTVAYEGGLLTWGELAKNNNTLQTGGETTAPNSVQSLAKSGEIQRWDTIEYDAGTASISNDDIELDGITLSGTLTANGTNYFNPEKSSRWCVLDITEDGSVLIIPYNLFTYSVEVNGIEGYNNYSTAINKIAQIYINNEYAKYARSINKTDLLKAEGIENNGRVASGTFSTRYDVDYKNLDIIDNGESEVIDRTFTTSTENGWQNFSISNFSRESKGSGFWVEGKCINLATKQNKYGMNFDIPCFSFMIGSVNSNQKYSPVSLITLNAVNDSNGNTTPLSEYKTSCMVMPVITLKPEVKIEKDENNIWQFIVD